MHLAISLSIKDRFLHFPALLLINAFSSKVMEQALMAQTADTPRSDSFVDRIGAETKGFPTRPNCPSPPFPNA